jgi:hypothetical protein
MAVFPTPGSPQEHGIVLRPSAQDLDDALDLVMAADDGVEFSFAGKLRKVSSEGIQRRGLRPSALGLGGGGYRVFRLHFSTQ